MDFGCEKLTGNVYVGFPVLILYTFSNTLRASSFLPALIRNLGLSGMKRKTVALKIVVRVHINKNTFQEWTSKNTTSV